MPQIARFAIFINKTFWAEVKQLKTIFPLERIGIEWKSLVLMKIDD